MSARNGKRWNSEKREWVVENLEAEVRTFALYLLSTSLH